MPSSIQVVAAGTHHLGYELFIVCILCFLQGFRLLHNCRSVSDCCDWGLVGTQAALASSFVFLLFEVDDFRIIFQ